MPIITKLIQKKINNLIEFVESKRTVVAFSRRVDSSLLEFISKKNLKIHC